MSTVSTASSAPSIRAGERFPVLDSLRGVAILSVFLHHALFWNGMQIDGLLSRAVIQLTRPGWLGVDLFFVLSGFLITGRLIDQKRDVAGDYYRGFYRRRALRILPLYYALIFVVGPIMWWAGETSFMFLAAGAVFLPNIALIVGWWATGPLAVLWSLGVEEQVYLVWPFLVRALSMRRLAWVLVAVGAIEPLLRWMTFSSGLLRESLSIATWLRLDGFAWGGLVAILGRDVRISRARLEGIGRGALIVSVCAAGLCASTGTLSQRTVVGASLQLACADVFFAGLVAVAVSRGSSEPRRSVLRMFGRISYCLYLVHMLALWCFDRIAGVSTPLPLGPSVLRAVIVLAICTAIAELSWRYIEAPSLGRGTAVAEPVVAGTL